MKITTFVDDMSPRAHLFAACRERGLSAQGSNPDLVKRVQDFDADPANAHLFEGDDEDPLADEGDNPDGAAGGPQPDGNGTPGAAADASPAPGEPGDEPETNPATTVGAEKATEELVKAAKKDKVEPAFGGRVVKGRFRREFVVGERDIDDLYHQHLIRETHEAARIAGFTTRGGETVGEKVGYGRDAEGKRTVIYEVSIKQNRR